MSSDWGDSQAGEHEDRAPVVIALLMALFWGFVLGWVAHMVIF